MEGCPPASMNKGAEGGTPACPRLSDSKPKASDARLSLLDGQPKERVLPEGGIPTPNQDRC